MSGSSEDWDRWSEEKEPPVTRNPYCQCDDHLSVRMRTRIAEADQAASDGRRRLEVLSVDAYKPYVETLWRTVRHHEAPAEALRDVLGGGF